MKENPLRDIQVEVRPTVSLGGEKVYGYADLREDKMVIATKPGDVVNTIIHEKLHLNYPNMAHEKVYENAKKIEGSLTLPDMAKELMEVHYASQAPDKNPIKITHVGEVPKIISDSRS